VPILVLTADRPHELRDIGAPQAMNQFHLFGSFAKQFIEMALPEAAEPMYRYARMTAGRAVAGALQTPKGPVHVNFPLREPLIPDFSLEELWEKGRGEYGATVHQGTIAVTDEYAASLRERLSHMEKGLIICGDDSHPDIAEAVVAFSKAYGYPIVADPLSGLRSGLHDKETIIDCYDTFLRNERLRDSWKPDVIIRFGGMPVSKALMQYLKKQTGALHIVVDESGNWRDPALISTEVVYANDAAFCEQLVNGTKQQSKREWLHMWQHMNAVVKEKLADIKSYEHAFEGKVITELVDVLPEEATLFVSNSMPIRDTDTFFFTNEKNIEVVANRGVNGIDGIVSTALGVSVARKPLVLVVGDLSFYHDLNGLLAAKLHDLHATIVVVNNDGGGIFSFLPQYEQKEHFEALFGTPLGLDYEHVVKMYNGSFERVHTWEAFRHEVNKGTREKGLHVIEIKTDREENLQLHRDMMAKAAVVVSQALQGEEN